MSVLAPTLEAFFTERLVNQRQPSPNTVAAYRESGVCCWCSSRGAPGRSPVSWIWLTSTRRSSPGSSSTRSGTSGSHVGQLACLIQRSGDG